MFFMYRLKYVISTKLLENNNPIRSVDWIDVSRFTQNQSVIVVHLELLYHNVLICDPVPFINHALKRKIGTFPWKTLNLGGIISLYYKRKIRNTKNLISVLDSQIKNYGKCLR